MRKKKLNFNPIFKGVTLQGNDMRTEINSAFFVLVHSNFTFPPPTAAVTSEEKDEILAQELQVNTDQYCTVWRNDGSFVIILKAAQSGTVFWSFTSNFFH